MAVLPMGLGVLAGADATLSRNVVVPIVSPLQVDLSGLADWVSGQHAAS